jgi:hypothetical protein
MSFTVQVVSPGKLTDAQKRVWLNARDAFIKAGGAESAPSGVTLDNSGLVRQVHFYKHGGVEPVAKVLVNADGSLQARVEWI